MVRTQPNFDLVDMRCADVRRHFVDYLEGDLEAGLSARFLRHLEGCSQCQAALDGMRNVIALLGELSEYGLPAELHQPRLDSWGDRGSRFDS